MTENSRQGRLEGTCQANANISGTIDMTQSGDSLGGTSMTLTLNNGCGAFTFSCGGVPSTVSSGTTINCTLSGQDCREQCGSGQQNGTITSGSATLTHQ